MLPGLSDGLLRGFQLWVNLPAANKMDAPEYQEYKSEAFPVVEEADYSAKVIIGRFGTAVSPILDDITHVSYFDVQVKPGKRFQYQLLEQRNSFLYVFEGSAQVNGQTVDAHTLVTLNSDTSFPEFVAGELGARFLLISGKPINESIVQYGPFVMNSRAEIDEAMRDYQSNKFVRDRAWITRKKTTAV